MNIFQKDDLKKGMICSPDADTRLDDNRIPTNAVMQLRWANNMATIKPQGTKIVEKTYKSVPDHPKSERSSPFYMTGGTKRSEKL